MALDGGMLALGSAQGASWLWRTPSAGGPQPAAEWCGVERPQAVFRGHTGAVTALALSLRLDSLASGGADGRVLLFALGSAQLLRCLEAGGGLVYSLALSPRDSSVAAYSCSATQHSLKLWSCNGVQLASTQLSAPLLALAFPPSSRFMLTASRPEGAVFRHPTTLQQLAAVAPPAPPGPGLSACALSPDGLTVALGLIDGSVGAARVPALALP
jgi:WD40 repeat protein